MGREYKTPEMNILELKASEVLTSSAIVNTEKAMRAGTLEINGNKLDGVADIVSIEF